jgi:hypothetical protein
MIWGFLLKYFSKWQLLGAIAVAVLLGAGYTVKQVYDAGKESATAQCLEKELKREKQYQDALKAQQDKINQLTVDLGKALSSTKVIVKEVEKKVEVEIEKPIYKECKVPETGVSLLNELATKLNQVRIK